MVDIMRPLPGSPHITQVWGPTEYQGEPAAFGYPHFHLGVDYACACGSTVYAPADGVVSFVGWDYTGFGLVVRLEHLDGFTSVLAHLQEAEVCKGQHVKIHQPVAHSGTTGNSTGCHLHWSVLKHGVYVSPASVARLDVW